MDIFDILTMIGGLCLFLFGMNIMGQALERRAGSGLRSLLGKLTSGKLAGFITGLAVTAVIQSSSATTVMVVGFVNSGIMSLTQAINVIMGANVGTTVTAWILSLGGIEGGNLFTDLLKPTSFTPILALIGIIFFMFIKSDKKKDTGLILLGFATLMFGMDTMSGAVEGLKDVPAFRNLFVMFKNPLLGVLAGALLTAIIQSSSASVGILQALSATGQVSFGAAIPIIMGQNIGTCVTALLSSVGTTKNARRASLVHLLFNIIGATFCIIIYMIIEAVLQPVILDQAATFVGISVCHSLFNVTCTAILLPMSGILEKLVCKIIPDTTQPEKIAELDERLLATPPLALAQCRRITIELALAAEEALLEGIKCLENYTPEQAQLVRELEDKTDHYEDILGSYLVKLSTQAANEADSAEAAGLLKLIGDFERIADHAVNLVESAEEINNKGLSLTDPATKELRVICDAVIEVVGLARKSFVENDLESAAKVEPLEEVIDDLKELLRTNHIRRLQRGMCSIEAGFVWSDLLTGLERISDHCSNVAVCLIDMTEKNMNQHAMLKSVRAAGGEFDHEYRAYSSKYFID